MASKYDISTPAPSNRYDVTTPSVLPPDQFDNTPLGIAKNTIFGLPAAALSVAADIFHGITRAGAAIPLTLNAASNERAKQSIAQGKTTDNLGHPISATAQTTLDVPGKDASQIERDAYSFLFGDQPIHDLATQVAAGEQSIKASPLAQKLGIDKYALPLAFGGTLGDEALNFLPAGGEKNLGKYLLNERNAESIAKFLVKQNVPEDVARSFAPHFADATTKEQVQEGIDLMKAAIGNSRLAAHEAAGASSIAEDAAPQAVKEAAPADAAAPRAAEAAATLEEHPPTAPVRAAAEAIPAETKPLEEITPTILRGAVADYEKTFAPKMQELFDQGTKIQKALDAASAAEKPLFKAQLDGIIAKQDDLEQEFVGKWREQAGLPREIPVDSGMDVRPMLDEMTKAPRDVSGGAGAQKYADLAAAQKLGDLLQKNYQRPQGVDAFIRDAGKALDMDSAKEAQLKGLYFRTVASRSKRTPEQLMAAAQDFTARGLRMRAISEIAAEGRFAPPASILKELPANDQASLRIILGDMTRTVKQKVNLLDWFTTPEFVLEKLGMGREAKMLQMAKDGYQKQLPAEIARITEWKKAAEAAAKDSNPEDVSRRLFKYLNGDKDTPTLPEGELAVANEIRAYLKEWANRLGLPLDKQITHYITHIFEPDLIQKEFDPDLARLISDKIPGSVYDPFLEKRIGTMGYKEDAWAALDAYVKRATRKVNFDPALEAVKRSAEQLDITSEKYIKRYADRINMRPTELDELTDNMLKSIPKIGYRFGQRPVTRLLSTLRQWYYRGTLGLNVGSALRNLTQASNTYAKLGERYSIQGYFKVLTKMLSRNLGELYDVGVLGDSFITDRKLGVYKQTLQKLDGGLFAMFETAEKINRGAAYFGAKARAINKGLSEADAVEYAKRLVRETQFSFGSVDSPLVIQQGGEIGRSLLQMEGFTLKQAEFLARMAKNKEFAGLVRYTIASLAMLGTIGKLFGMRMSDLVPLAGGYGGSPIGNLVTGAYGSLTAQTAQEKNDAHTKLTTSLVGLIPAGVQLRKSIQGYEAVKAGKDVTATGRLRFKVHRDVGTAIRAVLFGKSNLPEAQKYYDSLNKPKKAKSGNRYNI